MDAFVFSKLRYFTPLLGAEIHHAPTLHKLGKAYNACLRAELEAFPSTPIPLLYAGTRRYPLEQLIKRDSSLHIICSIIGHTLLSKEYLAWDGTFDGWSPLGITIPVFEKVRLYDLDVQYKYPLSISMRNGLALCKYVCPPNKIKVLRRPTIANADIALWCDGSFDRSNHTGAASDIVIIDDEIQAEEGQCYSNISSSYEAEL